MSQLRKILLSFVKQVFLVESSIKEVLSNYNVEFLEEMGEYMLHFN